MRCACACARLDGLCWALLDLRKGPVLGGVGAAPSRNHESKVIRMMGDDGDLSTPSQNMVSCYVRGNEPVVKNNGRALEYC